MRIRDVFADSEEPYNLVPLTDMVFNLLIFFMCATTFAQAEKDLSVKLPDAAVSFQPLSAPPKQLIINVREDGKAIVSAQPYDGSTLAALVADAVKRDPNISVTVRADERATVKHFSTVAAICRNAGVREARLSYLDMPVTHGD